MKTRSLALVFALAGSGAILACSGASDSSGSLYASATGSGGDPAPPPDQTINLEGGALAADDQADAASDAPVTKSCASATANASRTPIYMAMILDGSGSMNFENKWTAVVPAIDGFIDGLATSHDTGIAVGLTVFSDDGDPWQGTGDYKKEDVAIGVIDAAQQAAFHKRIDHTTPHYQTPTYPALSGTFPQLEAFKAAPPLADGGARVLVLITDGTPFLQPKPTDMPDTAIQQTKSLALVSQEFTKGIRTFVIGVGELNRLRDDTGALEYDAQFLGNLAFEGGTARPNCNPQELNDVSKMCHMQITPSQSKSAADLQKEFTAALSDIRHTVMSCEFKLSATGDVDPGHANVIYTNGAGVDQLLDQDAMNGWTYDDPNTPSKVVLHGASCDTAKSDPNGKVKVLLGCKAGMAMTK
jgi:hypothetical protein